MSLNTAMSLNSILNTATSGLQTNQTALRVTSNNIANVNTEGYHRRLVDFGPRMTAGALTGVTIDQIRRIADEFLARESNSSAGALGRAEVLNSFFDRAQDLIGSLNGGSSLDSRISSAMQALSQLSVDPSSIARRNAALSSIAGTLSAISNIASNIQGLRQDANTQLKTNVGNVNDLLKRIYELNNSIKGAVARGDTASAMLDQRDKAISDLAKFIDVRTFEQADGRVFVSLSDGTGLVSDLSSEFRYTGPSAVAASTSFPSLTLQRVNPEGGNDVGPAIALEGRLQGGSIRGLIDMRDKVLPDLAEQIGLIGSTLTEQLNAVHNNSASVPAPSILTGRNTGLDATDPLNFTGNASIAIVDGGGALVQRLDLNLSSYATVNDLVTAINSGLGANGSASFVNGVLTINASAGNGVAMLQDPSTPASRGGRGLSQFFGLNDLVVSTSPSSFATGVAGGDAHGFNAGGQTDFVLRSPSGAILRTFSVTVGGTTVNDMITNLNTAAGGVATFALDAKGQISMTPAGAYAGARLEVTNDTSARGTTGLSLSQFFGLGTAMRQTQAAGLGIRSDISTNAAKLSLAELDLLPTTSPGDVVLGVSDNRGALKLAGIANANFSWGAAGNLAAGTMSIGEYVAQVMGSQSDLLNAAKADQIYRQDVSEEIGARKSSAEGVNIDEELSNMMVFQQAYNASARLMTVVQQMYDTLFDVVR